MLVHVTLTAEQQVVIIKSLF